MDRPCDSTSSNGTVFQGCDKCVVRRPRFPNIKESDFGVKNQRCNGGVISRHFAPVSLAPIELQSPVVTRITPFGDR